ARGILQDLSPAPLNGRVMALYTAIATATSMAGMTFFGWLMEISNESVSLVGIGTVLLVLAVLTAWFRRRLAREPFPIA
ncbi:MAG: hypothetical protein AB7V39_17880, partial [Nitrospiraceae bacterium]